MKDPMTRLARRIADAGAMAVLLFSALSYAPDAHAQSLHLNHYRAAETPDDGWVTSRPTDLGHIEYGARLDLDYAWNPLVYEETLGDPSSESGSVVEHHLSARLGLALGLFDRLVVYGGVPVSLLMDGVAVDGLPRADGTAVGDASLGVRGRIYGEADDMVAVAVQVSMTFPTAQGANPQSRFAGEDGVTVTPEALVEVRPGLGIRIDANLGARLRATDRARFDDASLIVSHELTWALAVSVPIVERLRIALEAFGSSPFERFADRASSPVEALLGLRWAPVDRLSVGLAGGLGLARGYGAPDFRGVLMVGWRDSFQAPPSTVRVNGSGPGGSDLASDATGSGGSGGGPGGGSDDGDTRDGEGGRLQGDGAAGARTPGDRDADGVPDATDGAPDDPEDRDGFEDADGVPDPDNDADAVLDVDDACPRVPGTPETHGCPRAIRLDRGQIVILERVEFATGEATILSRSESILEEVRGALEANPSILRVRVEGHTDDRGADSANAALSLRRARAVVDWLVAHGIDHGRLTASGCGENHPREENRTAEGRQNNRRVEFHIEEPASEGLTVRESGCQSE